VVLDESPLIALEVTVKAGSSTIIVAKVEEVETWHR
jgi:hypothetical protein